MPPGSSGTSQCGGYAGFVNFTNSPTGYVPDAGTTKCVGSVVAGTNSVPNTDFDLFWRTSATDKGCAAVGTGSTTHKSFASSPAKRYAFTVYFKPGKVPAQGTDIALTITFQ